MEFLSAKFILIYSLYTILTGFQYGQVRSNIYVKSNKKTTNTIIKSFAIFGIIFQYIILIYLGLFKQWYFPFILFGIGLIVEKVYAEFEMASGLYKIGYHIYLISFFAIPICGYLMIITML